MSKMIKYSIPYNGDLELTKWAIASGQVYEVYFAGAGKNNYSLPYPHASSYSHSDVIDLVNLCAENGVGRNLLMNKSNLYWDNVKDIFAYIKSFKKYGGITSVTIADHMVLPYLLKAFPSIDVQLSIFSHIDNANKVRQAYKMGVKSFCLDMMAGRNGEGLERIRDLKAYYSDITIKLLANHGCFQQCFYLLDHEKWVMAKSLKEHQKKDKYMLGNMTGQEDRCFCEIKNISEEIKRPFIRPEDITYYEQKGLADYIKLCYRRDKSSDLKRRMKAYFERSYCGDLFDITMSSKGKISFICQNKKFPEDFVEKVLYCGSACEICDYCDQVAKKVLIDAKVYNAKKAYTNEK